MAGETLTQGTKLQRGDGGAPEIFTNVPGITGITGLRSGQAGEIDTTDFDSTAKEFLPGLRDEGSLTANMKIILGNAQQEGLIADRAAQVARNFRIVYRDGRYRQFTGLVMAVPEDFNPDEVVRGGLTIRLTGPIGALTNP
jgi:hypothetical protein